MDEIIDALYNALPRSQDRDSAETILRNLSDAGYAIVSTKPQVPSLRTRLHTRLRNRRRSLGLTQAQMASQARMGGRKNIAVIESGQRPLVAFRTIVKIAAVLKLDPCELAARSMYEYTKGVPCPEQFPISHFFSSSLSFSGFCSPLSSPNSSISHSPTASSGRDVDVPR